MPWGVVFLRYSKQEEAQKADAFLNRTIPDAGFEK